MTDDRRAQGERRNHADRRRGTGPRGYLLRLLKGERRQLEDRRRGLDGKAGADRRSPRQTATDLVRGAFDLLPPARSATGAKFDHDTRQRVDSAPVRLKVAPGALAKAGNASPLA